MSSENGGYWSVRRKRYASTRDRQRRLPTRKEAKDSGSRPVNRAANQPRTTSTRAAMLRKYSTTTWGMASRGRKKTTTLRWGSDRPNAIWRGVDVSATAGAAGGTTMIDPPTHPWRASHPTGVGQRAVPVNLPTEGGRNEDGTGCRRSRAVRLRTKDDVRDDPGLDGGRRGSAVDAQDQAAGGHAGAGRDQCVAHAGYLVDRGSPHLADPLGDAVHPVQVGLAQLAAVGVDGE